MTTPYLPHLTGATSAVASAASEIAAAYLEHLRGFSSTPSWHGYGYYQGAAPSPLDLEVDRPVTSILEEFDGEGELDEYVSRLVESEDPRVAAVYGRDLEGAGR